MRPRALDFTLTGCVIIIVIISIFYKLRSAAAPSPVTCNPFSPCVILDPDGCLDQDTRDKFIALNLKFDDLFNPSISKYNGASGKIEAVVNIGPTLGKINGKRSQFPRLSASLKV